MKWDILYRIAIGGKDVSLQLHYHDYWATWERKIVWRSAKNGRGQRRMEAANLVGGPARYKGNTTRQRITN